MKQYGLTRQRSENEDGFSLLELLIVISIISIVLVSIPITFNFRTQVDKGYDVTRKKDLNFLSTRLEEFYSDHTRYPKPDEICHNETAELEDVFDSGSVCCNICGKASTPAGMASYVNPLPCDPQYSTRDYLYEILNNDNPQSYKIYSHISLPDINAFPASCVDGCGPDNQYYFGISSSNKVID